MQKQTRDGLTYYTFDRFDDAVVTHGVFTRLGGASQPPYASLNLGHTVGDDDAAVEANHDAIYATLGIGRGEVVTAHQVHGHAVRRVGWAEAGQVMAATDGLVSNEPGLTLLMRFADCLSLLFYDPVQRAVGLAHAGWRGTMQNIAGETVRALAGAFGSDPATLHVGLGPTIQACCYEVGDEVIQAARAQFPASLPVLVPGPRGTPHFDLVAANRWQLEQAGVRQIEVAPLCTSCRVDEFFSYRAEQGRTGRFAVLLGLRKGQS